MTFEQCHTHLLAIRRKQGTRCPAVRVAYNGVIYSGRVKHADSDPEARRASTSPFGVLVLENLGLAEGPRRSSRSPASPKTASATSRSD